MGEAQIQLIQKKVLVNAYCRSGQSVYHYTTPLMISNADETECKAINFSSFMIHFTLTFQFYICINFACSLCYVIK